MSLSLAVFGCRKPKKCTKSKDKKNPRYPALRSSALSTELILPGSVSLSLGVAHLLYWACTRLSGLSGMEVKQRSKDEKRMIREKKPGYFCQICQIVIFYRRRILSVRIYCKRMAQRPTFLLFRDRWSVAQQCWIRLHCSSNVRELTQRLRRRQREQQKSNRFRQAKQQLCTCITLFCTFLCRRCTTATWNGLISRFVEDGNKRQQFSFSFPELWCSPLEFNYNKNCQHFTN